MSISNQFKSNPPEIKTLEGEIAAAAGLYLFRFKRGPKFHAAPSAIGKKWLSLSPVVDTTKPLSNEVRVLYEAGNSFLDHTRKLVVHAFVADSVAGVPTGGRLGRLFSDCPVGCAPLELSVEVDVDC
ncbi:hypothetical protein LEP1GSC176_0262 [Leptospira kirschneri str. MMD1493]|nr:hypothetical protein LEP1GSC176_0262 [Leptospira kirschneri str. MMD1493]